MSRRPLRPTPRTVAAEVVRRVERDGAYVAPALDAALSESGLDARDRGLCTELVQGTLRWLVPLEASLRRAQDRPKKLDARIRPHLLVAAYQLQHLGERIPARAAVHEAVDAVKAVRPGLAGLANALLRNLGSPLHEQVSADAPLDEQARAFGVPLALAQAVTEGLDDKDRLPALAGLNARPSLGLWTPMPTEVRAALAEERVEVRPHAFLPNALLLDAAGDVGALSVVGDGRATVMDPGSIAAALLVGASPGQRVLDLCAAPGGKALVLAAAVGPPGRVVCVEKDPRRARLVEENAARMKTSLALVVGDAADPDLALSDGEPGPDQQPVFDAVLLDAPCSALGTTRRRPDVKLPGRQDERGELPSLQARLLAAAARRVRPGGALVYAVCTPLPEEGRDQIARFLEENPGWRLQPAREILPLPDDAERGGALQLLPHLHDADAFFAARLVRDA